eukprot:1217318-Prymnesium_polylepis.1
MASRPRRRRRWPAPAWPRGPEGALDRTPLVVGQDGLLERRVDGAIAEGLDRKDAEGLLDLKAELLDAEEEEDRKGEQPEPEADVARGVPRVDQRDGRLEDALARADVVAEH